jgi:TatD DNase family protein
MKLFDAHCHLQDDALFPDFEKVMQRAVAAGVERAVCCGTAPRDWEKVFQCSEKSDGVLPMVGIHPWFVAKDWKRSFRALENLLQKHPEAGIGETGLDFQARFINRAEQEACFAAHLDLACELNRPVTVHCVRAWGRLSEILHEHPAPRIQLHAFGGAAELIPELGGLNCWFSFGGSVTNPRAKRARGSVAAVPPERLLIETDAPDFPPADCSSPNEPANLIYILRTVAELRSISIEEASDVLFRNSINYFALNC